MNEKVLAAPRATIEDVLRQGFFEVDNEDLLGRLAEESVFLDRPAAEQDPTHKQVIPYILVTHRGRFLVYQRTKKQGEARLHNKLSLGFGGHINDIDSNADSDTNLILAAMVRELNEELYLPSVKCVQVAGFINDDSNAVGQVHLGVAFIVEAAHDKFSVNEPDKIEARWCEAREVDESLPSLESWSQMLWTQHIRPRLAAVCQPQAAEQPMFVPAISFA